MKNLLSVLALTISVNIALAQEKLTDYHSTYFAKDYEVSVGKSKDGDVSFYINAESMDKSSKTGFLIIKEKDLEAFITSIQALKEIHSKWKKTAIENSVTELSKEMNAPKFRCSAGFSYGKWQFDFSVQPAGTFKIIDGKYLAVLHSGELQSSSNQFMKNSGLVIVFDDEKAFDGLLAAVNLTKAKELLNKKDKAASLFE